MIHQLIRKVHTTFRVDGLYTSAESLTTKMLANIFDLREVAVGKGVFMDNNAPEDAPFKDIWGNNAILAYTPVDVKGMEQPSYGYTYSLVNHPFVEKPVWDNDTRSWIYGVTYERRPVLSGVAAGFLIQKRRGRGSGRCGREAERCGRGVGPMSKRKTTPPEPEAKPIDNPVDWAREIGEIEIFRAGTFRAMNGKEYSFTAQDVADIAGAFDPNKAPVPVVIGHPKADEPAYAWLKDVYAKGDIVHRPEKWYALFG